MMNTYRSKSLMQLNVLDTSEYPLYRHLTRPYPSMIRPYNGYKEGYTNVTEVIYTSKQ